MSRPGTKKTTLLLALAASLLAAGCELPPPAAPISTKKAVLVPSMKSAAQSAQAQERGGIVLELPAPEFRLTKSTTTTCSLAGTITDSNGTPLYDILQTTEEVATPPNLEFKLKATNHSTKIVKFEGVMLKLVVDGNEAAIQNADAVKQTVLRPDDTKDVAIVGPEWGTLPQRASVALSVYGVPTEFDDANTVTKTENFDWAFDYEVTSVEKDVKIVADSQYLTELDVQATCQQPDETGSDKSDSTTAEAPAAPPQN